ncbi:hypothetical protein [Methanosarcina barkeri]|uniref:hypothetical protein n=1 Tax=Methanosarcina barkeri TaxID=2208 RepID=UPI001FB4101B|nr:hypothetical protein [Methanosarcina barkeri]
MTRSATASAASCPDLIAYERPSPVKASTNPAASPLRSSLELRIFLFIPPLGIIW